ncbi:hypothetical protein D3C72_1338520 [compost metagenome]
MVARIARDRLEQLRDLLPVAFERLQEDAVAVAQHAGDAVARIAFQAGGQDGVEQGGVDGLAGTAGIEQAD